MIRSARILKLAFLVLLLGLVIQPAVAQQNPPAVVFEGLMDSYFGDEDGLVSFTAYDIVFAPEGPAKVLAAIVDKDGNVLSQFEAYPDYGLREGVFGRVQIKGPADVKLTEPGLYTMVFLFDGKPMTRFPFLLKQTGAGDDPYDPKKTYAFDGYWRTLAHITTETYSDETIPVFSLWLGGLDMPSPDTFQATFEARLLRDGKLIAHAKEDTSSYSNGHFKRTEVMLYHPHDRKKSPNAVPITMEELLVDGEHELIVTRSSDGKKLRHYRFTVSDGKIQPLARTQLGFEPASDFIVPRVSKKGSTGYEFEEAIWIGTQK